MFQSFCGGEQKRVVCLLGTTHETPFGGRKNGRFRVIKIQKECRNVPGYHTFSAENNVMSGEGSFSVRRTGSKKNNNKKRPFSSWPDFGGCTPPTDIVYENQPLSVCYAHTHT